MGTAEVSLTYLQLFRRFGWMAGLLLSPALREPPPGPGLGPPAERPSAALAALPFPADRPSGGPVLPVSMESNAPPPVSGRIEPPAPPEPAALSEPPPDAYELWRQWQRLVERRAYQQMPIVNALLADSLRHGSGAEIYQEIAGLLRDDSLAFQVRAQLIDLLGEIATPEALALLLKTAGQGMESPMYAPALNTLGHIGENRWGGRFHEELSPMLEQAWKAAGNTDWPYLVAVTQAIVGIGAPSGIALLLDTLASRNAPPSASEETRGKQVAVFSETPKVTNPAAVSVLKRAVMAGVDTSRIKLTGASGAASQLEAVLASTTDSAESGDQQAGLAPADSGVSLSPVPAEPGSPSSTTSADPVNDSAVTAVSQHAPGGTWSAAPATQPAVVSVAIKGLENIGTEAAMHAIVEITQSYPETRAYLAEPVVEPAKDETAAGVVTDPGAAGAVIEP